MTIPSYELEMLANEQRKQLVNSIEELKSRARENFDFRRRIREYPVFASGLAASLGLIAGYRAGGVFRTRRSQPNRWH